MVKYIFRSEKGKNTCDRCKSYDGKIYYDLKDAPTLPLHPNCRCYLEAVEDKNYSKEYKTIRKDFEKKKITKEEFIEQVKEKEKSDIKKADTEFLDTKNKEILKGAIDIVSASIPIGGGAKIAGKIAKELTPAFGKKISASISKGVVDGLKQGMVHGALIGIVDKDEKTLLKSIEEGVIGAITGGTTNYGTGKIYKKIAANKLKTTQDIKKLRKAETDYYKSYNQGRKINHKELGEINFTQAGLETASRKPEAGRNYDTLINDIKKAKYKKGKDEPPAHARKDKTEKFRMLENDKQEFLIAESKSGDKKYYMSKIKDGPETRPSRGGAVPSTSIITDGATVVNPKMKNMVDIKNTEDTIDKILPKTLTSGIFTNLKNAEDEKDKAFLEGFKTGKLSNFKTKHMLPLVNGKILSDKELEAFLEGFMTGKMK